MFRPLRALGAIRRLGDSHKVLRLVESVVVTLSTASCEGRSNPLDSTRAKKQAEAALRVMTGLPGVARPRELRLAPSEGEEIGVTIPKEAFELLLEVLGQMANGNAVTVVPVQAELTTQQAAELLNVSRPFLVGLLDSGKIPCRLVGSHRRVRLADLTAYREADERQRRAALDELTLDAQKHGFGH